MKSDISLLGILKCCNNGKTSRQQINYLVEFCFKIAKCYIKHRYKNFNKILMTEDLSLTKMSLDAIAPIFEPDDNNIFTKIRSAFENWQPKIENDAQAMFFI